MHPCLKVFITHMQSVLLCVSAGNFFGPAYYRPLFLCVISSFNRYSCFQPFRYHLFLSVLCLTLMVVDVSYPFRYYHPTVSYISPSACVNEITLLSDIVVQPPTRELTHCGLVTSHGDIDHAKHWPTWWLIAWWYKPLTELMLIYHLICSVALAWEQFHKKCSLT